MTCSHGYRNIFCQLINWFLLGNDLISTIFPEDIILSIILHWILWVGFWFQLIFPGGGRDSENVKTQPEHGKQLHFEKLFKWFSIVCCCIDFQLCNMFNQDRHPCLIFFQFSYVETVLCAIGDEFPHLLRKRRNNIIFRAIVIGTAFLLGLPMVCNVSRK